MWNFDMGECPRDKSVILAGKSPHVTRSRWLEKEGRWEAFSLRDAPPVAWMLWPDHPEAGL